MWFSRVGAADRSTVLSNQHRDPGNPEGVYVKNVVFQ